MNLLLIPELNTQFVLFCIFCLTILILLWYYLFYFARVAFYKEKKKFPNDIQPASIIVCAKNEDHTLPEFLPLVLSQDYPEYEVIVVDDCSWDNTTDVLREFKKKYKHLKVITIKEDEKHPHGKKFAVMVGIKGTKYESILFTDADCKPIDNQWLKKMVRNFSDKTEIVLGYSKYEKLPGFLNKLIRYDTFQIALQYLSFAMAGTPYMGVGRNFAYKKTLFFKHKGFASHCHIESGDDDLFVNEASTRTNTKAEISTDSFTISQVKKNWKEWIEQKRRHLSTWKEYKLSDKLRLGLYLFSQIFFWMSFIALMFFQYETYIVLAAFGFRWLIQMIIFKLAMNKLKEQDLFLLLFISEIFFLGFYFVLMVLNCFMRKNKWKKI
ncbi:MAG: glycosyltransferase [Bacteroidota bacterium]